MLRIIIILSFFIMGITGKGQKQGIFHSEEMKTMDDAWGRPIRPQTTYKIEGNPFFPEKFTSVRFHFNNGKYNSSTKARINLNENKIIYLHPNGDEMELIIPVHKLEFRDSFDNTLMTLQNGFVGEHLDPEKYYQVLDSGKIVLLKHHIVIYRDFSPYGTAVITRTFEQKIFYFIIKEGKSFKLTRNPNSILMHLQDKELVISDYLKKKKLNLKEEPGIIDLIRYYNLQDTIPKSVYIP